MIIPGSFISDKDFGDRQRLRPWLEHLLNSGTIPGLYWLNEDKTKFRIPWEHAGKHDWTPDKSQIFMVCLLF